MREGKERGMEEACRVVGRKRGRKDEGGVDNGERQRERDGRRKGGREGGRDRKWREIETGREGGREGLKLLFQYWNELAVIWYVFGILQVSTLGGPTTPVPHPPHPLRLRVRPVLGEWTLSPFPLPLPLPHLLPPPLTPAPSHTVR